MDLPEIGPNDLTCYFKGPIAKGSFASVYTGQWNAETVAVKKFEGSALYSPAEIKEQLYEGEILNSLKHPNIIVIFGFHHPPTRDVSLVMEYAEGGSLQQVVKKFSMRENHVMKSSKVYVQWATQIASGLEYMHEQNCVHRDLKSNNVLIKEPITSDTDVHNKTLKIADFGYAEKGFDKTKTSSRISEAFLWQAPETRTGKYSLKSDVWSYGIIVYEILCGTTPEYLKVSLSNENEPFFCADIPGSFKVLLAGCCKVQRNERSTMKEVLEQLQVEAALPDSPHDASQVYPSTINWSQSAPKDCLELDLSNRKLTAIPDDVLQIAPRVAVLDLSGNPDIQLVSSLRKFVNLASLSLKDCRFLDLPDDIWELLKLEKLNLDGSTITKDISKSIKNLVSLRDLNVGELRAVDLPEHVCNIASLKKLCVASVNGFESLSPSIGKLKSLTELTIVKSAFIQVPAAVFELHLLQKLTLEDNMQLEQLDGDRNDFGKLTALKELSIIMFGGLKRLPESFGILHNLKKLTLKDNLQLEELCGSLSDLTALQELIVTNCKLKSLPNTFERLQNLIVLNLKNNQLNEYPRFTLRLEKLRTLDLSNDRLHAGNQIKEMPVELAETGLEKLSIDNNPITEPPMDICKAGVNAIKLYFQRNGDARAYANKVEGTGSTVLTAQATTSDEKPRKEEILDSELSLAENIVADRSFD